MIERSNAAPQKWTAFVQVWKGRAGLLMGVIAFAAPRSVSISGDKGPGQP